MATRKRRAKIKEQNTVYVDNIQFEQLTFDDILRINDTEDTENTENTENTVELKVNAEIIQDVKATDRIKEVVAKRAAEVSDEISDRTLIDKETGKINKPIITSINLDAGKGTFIGAYNKKELEIKIEREKARRLNTFPYKASDNILTRAEGQLFHYMKNFIQEDVLIFPKVRLADVIEIDKDLEYSDRDFFKICYKHVDFLLCDGKTFNTICVVELDDYTHDTDEAKQKDLFIRQALYECGIPLVRIRTKIDIISDNDMVDIDHIIKTYFAPPCPICGSKMEVKSSKRSFNFGHRFWSCKQFPNCKGNIDID